MVRPNVCLIANVEPFKGAVMAALRTGLPPGWDLFGFFNDRVPTYQWETDLIVVAGWRRLLSPEILDRARLGAVGFHSAKLPEYPGRAPVPWTLLRGDTHAFNTFFYLDEGVDTGDIIDQESRPIRPDETPETLNQWMAESSAAMLLRHLPALLDGTAPRTPQDMSLRGPLTTKDGWQRLAAK